MDFKNILKEYVMKKSQFLDLPDGGTETVTYLGFEEIPNKFDDGKTTAIRYFLKVNGKKLMWDRTNRDLAKQMIDIDSGQEIIITRKGQQSKTRYFIKKR